MSDHHSLEESMPRAPLIAIAVLIGFTLLLVTTVRVLGLTAGDEPAAALVDRQLHFEDLGGGYIAIIDATSDSHLQSIGPGEQGFIRATVRGLAQQRLRQGSGPGEPFVLSGRADGRLFLEDPVTGRIIDLTAFGHTNASAFAELLTAEVGVQ